MEFGVLMRKMMDAACAGDGRGVASCFTPDGVYHDVFYGPFEGHDRIADMIENYFHRDARNFRWDTHQPVSDGKVGYVRYVFSYESRLPGCEGRRTMFEGISVVQLKAGLIHHYAEVANTAPGLQKLGFVPERLARIYEKQGAELASRDEARGHV